MKSTVLFVCGALALISGPAVAQKAAPGFRVVRSIPLDPSIRAATLKKIQDVLTPAQRKQLQEPQGTMRKQTEITSAASLTPEQLEQYQEQGWFWADAEPKQADRDARLSELSDLTPEQKRRIEAILRDAHRRSDALKAKRPKP